MAPPRWPRLVIAGVVVAVAVAWSAMWDGWIGRDWAYWATSSGALLVAVTGAIWRESPDTSS